MKYRETCADGSFKAWGTGFRYEYQANINNLLVTHEKKDFAFAHLKFDKYIAQHPLRYVEALDKTHQIKALMLSNNGTVNLADTMEVTRIGALIKSAARISRHAYDLNFKNFSRFSRHFAEEFDLKHFKIKRFQSGNGENRFFVARVQTQHDNSVSVRACTLEGMLAALSERTMRDLITMEFGHQYQNSALSLLNLSTKLSTISNILDENFIPERLVRHVQNDQEQAKF